MTVKQIEQLLLDYIKQNHNENRKENALKELKMFDNEFKSKNLSNILFIVGNYPQYNHFLFKVECNDFFMNIGLSNNYLKSLNKKDIHKLAKGLHSIFYKLELSKENKQWKQ